MHLFIGPDKEFYLPKIAIIFLPINSNMCFGCSKEPSHRDGSFEYPQHMFWMRNKENNFPIHTLIWRPAFYSSSIFSKESTFRKKIQDFVYNTGSTTRVSQSLDLDQTRQFVAPDLSPGCFQRLSADTTSRQ